MQRPYIDILVEMMKEGHKETMNYSLDASERFDKIIVWIIGLSTGSIALLISANEKLISKNSKAFNVTIALLVLVIIFGILSRLLSSIAYQMGVGLYSNYYSQLSMLTFPHEPRELKGDETAEIIYRLMIEDFRIDMPSILDYKKYPEDKWSVLHEAARKFYLDYEKWSESQLENDFKKVSAVMENSLGYKDGYIIEKAKSQKSSGKFMRRLSRLGYALNVISLLLFGTAVIIFAWYFVN